MIYRQRLDLIHLHPAFATVERILHALTQAGFEAVLAGGCVRDAMLGRQPKDLDVATSAGPDLVESLFANTLNVGIAFGTIVVLENGFQFEVTTFRRDGPYLDGRHPTHVEFTGMEEDAKRRDFTVNALFYDPNGYAVYDHVGGKADLDQRVIRTVGLASERFSEDALRILRAPRFVAQLGFSIAEPTRLAMVEHSQSLRKVSPERVLAEMQKLLAGDHLAKGMAAFTSGGLVPVLWPEIQTFKASMLTPFLTFLSWENAFSAIHFLSGALETEPRLRAWKASKESVRRVQAQLRGLQVLLDPRSGKADRVKALGGPEFADVLVLASGVLLSRGERRRIEEWINEYLEVADSKGHLPQAFVTGDDLLKLGVQPGPRMGKILDELYVAQLEGQVQSKADALKLAGVKFSVS